MAAEFAESLGHNVAPPAELGEQTWREIDRLADELAGLSRSAVAIPEFYAALLERLAAALAVDSGAVWQFVPAKPVVRIAETGPALAIGGDLVRWVDGLRADARSAPDQSLVAPPHSTGNRSAVANPSPSPLVLRLLQPDELLQPNERAAWLVVLALSPTASPAAQRAAAQLLDLFCESALDLHHRHELQARRKQESNLREFDQLVARLHGSLNLNQTAYTLANDGRLWIGCDRVSVALLPGGQARVRAVSGSQQVDRRAQQVRSLEALLTAISASGEPLQWPFESGSELPPQLAAPLQTYLDDSHARQLLAVPLRASSKDDPSGAAAECVGMLLAESFDAGQPNERLRQRVDEVARHGGAALAHALAHHDLPLRPLQERAARMLRALRRRPIAALCATLGVAAVVAALVFIPADFSVSATGTLVPQSRRHLFAPADGVVEEVVAQHGQQVAAGQELLRLRDPQLDLDYSRISGELQTAQARLAAIRARRSSRSSATSPQEEERQLAAEEEQLKQLQDGLAAQLQVLERHRAELRITSPMAGVVLTWNPAELLQDRPVREGQRLLTVADPSGAWVLELPVPDAAIGHILAAQQRDQAELSVTFLLATEPAVTHRGRLARVAQNSETADGQPPSVLVTAVLDDAAPASARSGAGVRARIHCGQRPIGYVWLHDLIDAVRTQILF